MKFRCLPDAFPSADVWMMHLIFVFGLTAICTEKRGSMIDGVHFHMQLDKLCTKKEDHLAFGSSLDETQYRVDCNFECMQSQRSIGI